MDSNAQNEEAFIADIKQAIQQNTHSVSQKVIESAYSYLGKNGCLNQEKDDVIQDFFVKKIPGVLAKEISKKLDEVLGLNLEV